MMDNRVDLINKLLRKAENKGCTEEEAQAFFDKAQQLMAQWAIDDAMLSASRGGHGYEEKVSTTYITIPSTYFDADMQLLLAAANANRCKVLQMKGRGKGGMQGVLVGFTGDRERAEMLFQSLRIAAANGALTSARNRRVNVREYWGDDEEKPGWNDYVYKRSFRLGFAHRVQERVRENVRVAEQTAKVERTDDYLPVMVSRDKQVDQLTNALSSGKAARSGKKQHDWNGAQAGRAAGNNADLGNERLAGRRGLSR